MYYTFNSFFTIFDVFIASVNIPNNYDMLISSVLTLCMQILKQTKQTKQI